MNNDRGQRIRHLAGFLNFVERDFTNDIKLYRVDGRCVFELRGSDSAAPLYARVICYLIWRDVDDEGKFYKQAIEFDVEQDTTTILDHFWDKYHEFRNNLTNPLIRAHSAKKMACDPNGGDMGREESIAEVPSRP